VVGPAERVQVAGETGYPGSERVHAPEVVLGEGVAAGTVPAEGVAGTMPAEEVAAA
jgi:hypothetical protein